MVNVINTRTHTATVRNHINYPTTENKLTIFSIM